MLSIPHLIIIFLVALVVFGPEKLPELARNVGKFMVEFRRITGEFKGTLDDHLRDLEREGNARKAAAEAAAAAAKAPQAAASAPTLDDRPTASETVTASTPVGSEPPTVTPAEGIVPSADPRVVSEAPLGDPNPSSSEHSSDGEAARTAAEASYPPEPVTDGEHSTH
jgi:sec-independent protein translocase protein TatB